MGNALELLAALAALLYLGWWLATRHPADQHHNPNHQEK
ncbi:hypothetical protein TPA4_58 [Tsukamurella phage TPA4]|nr:hypothetical protein BH784_gp58 [Tsukamurella phage TPA4]AKJ72223.1 hypothetical protein TPA4_58 [Tsukamurella phage TPA4]